MNFRLIASSVIAGSLLAALPACKSSKEVASEVASRDVRSFQQSLDQIPGQIDRTMASLSQLTAGDVADRSKAFADFSKDLSTLKTHAMEVAAQKDEAERNVQRYFREWVKESRGMKSTQSRDAAYKAIESDSYRSETALGYMRNGSRDFRALIDKLNGFQNTLKSDLSPDAIRRVGEQFGVTNDEAIKVKGYIARLSEQIDSTLAGG